MSIMCIPWQWGALDRTMGLRSPVISFQMPHQFTRDLQLNTEDMKKLYHILSLLGASEPIISVSVYS